MGIAVRHRFSTLTPGQHIAVLAGTESTRPHHKEDKSMKLNNDQTLIGACSVYGNPIRTYDDGWESHEVYLYQSADYDRRWPGLVTLILG